MSEDPAARTDDDEHKVSIRTEAIAGVTTFFTMAYIVVVNPLTFSITQGILWGFITHTGLYLIMGRAREVHPVMYALALVSIGLLLIQHR